MKELTLKPRKVPFLLSGMFGFLILGVFVIFALYAWLHLSVLVLATIFVVIEVFGFFSTNISYKKEKYTIKQDKIIENSGGIFSDSEKELHIKNITHLRLKLGWIEQKLFQTGSVKIESAGSDISEIVVRSIDNPEDVYGKLQELMIENGFQMQRKEVLEEEIPSQTAVLLEVGRNALFWLAFIGYTFFIFAPAVILILAIAIPATLMNYYSLIRKEYKLYKGSITYNDNFLTKVRAVVPIENLADTTLTQGIINRILGIYDLTISCQGSGQEIKFKNIEKGKRFDDKIDKIIKTGGVVSLETQERREASSGEEKEAEQTEQQKRGLVSVAKKFQNIRKDKTRALAIPGVFTIVGILLASISTASLLLRGISSSEPIGLIIYPFMIGFIILFSGGLAIVRKVISLYATKYSVKEQSVREEYKFLSTNVKEFSDDKITGVYFRESLLDMFFDTCSVHFWSLGSGVDIEFSGIKKSSELDGLVREKFGYTKPVQHSMSPDFSFGAMMKKKTLTSIMVIILLMVVLLVSIAVDTLIGFSWFIPPLVMVGLVVVGYLLNYAYSTWYYDNVELNFCSDYIYFTEGLITRYEYFVHYNDIRGITTTKYPFTDFGAVKFKVSGEQVVKTDKGKSINTNDFSVDYIANIPAKDEIIDLILEHKVKEEEMSKIEDHVADYKEENVLTTKPSLANSLVPAVVICIIFFPLLPLLPIILAYVILSIKNKTFYVQPYRAVKKWGIIYKKQQSVVFRKIDHINKSQGMLNKIFNNGNVTVNTVESSATEMKLVNMEDYEEFYKKLKESY